WSRRIACWRRTWSAGAWITRSTWVSRRPATARTRASNRRPASVRCCSTGSATPSASRWPRSPRRRSPWRAPSPRCSPRRWCRAPRADAVTVDVAAQADLERLAGLAWNGPGAPRTAVLARGDDAALLARALAHAEGAYLRLENGVEGVAPLAAAAWAAGKSLIV